LRTQGGHETWVANQVRRIIRRIESAGD